jgi:DNA-binding transcriptional LysR family regulator
MLPELRQLRYFVAVAEELHFSKAARRLNIAQPPLSQQIQQLELTVGAPLFVRTTRRVELTPAGRVFLDGARRTLAEAERASEAALRASRGSFETLRVGFTEAATMSVLPRAVQRFRGKFPEVHIELHEDASATALIDALHRDVIDVAIARGPVEASGLSTRTLLEERFCLALPATHALAKRTRIPVTLLAGEPLVMFPRRRSPAYYDQLLGICQDAGFTPVIAFEVLRYTTIMGLVAAGVACGIVPRSNQSFTREGVVYRELTGVGATAELIAVHRREQNSGALESFLAAAK